MKVWLLYENSGDQEPYQEPYLYGVFSSVQAGITWLRKSSRFMHEPVGPIIPTETGHRYHLTARFVLIPHDVDPTPLAAYDMSPVAMLAQEPHKNDASIVE